VSRNALAATDRWNAMIVAIRNLGRPGICSMAIAAVDSVKRPSYSSMPKEEKHSTRGRARLLFEMLQGEVIKDGGATMNRIPIGQQRWAIAEGYIPDWGHGPAPQLT
jgi:hypothetical protein